MKIKDSIKHSMELLSKNDKTIFIGYNVKYGNRGGGAFVNIPEYQLLETPPAENLMVGLATGLSLEGFTSVVYFERFDFILNGLDAIVNHLMKFESLSDGQFVPKVIFRVVVGRKKSPFFSGVTHTQDFTPSMKTLLNFAVINPSNSNEFINVYNQAFNGKKSYMIVENSDDYEIDC